MSSQSALSQNFQPVQDTAYQIIKVIFQVGDAVGVDGVYRLIRAFPHHDIEFIVVSPVFFARVLYAQLKNQISDGLRIKFALVDFSMTSWTRDPFTVWFNGVQNEWALLPARTNHHNADLAAPIFLLEHNLGVPLSKLVDPILDIQGGDLRVDDQYVYVTRATLYNSTFDRTGAPIDNINTDDVLERMRAASGREVFVFGDQKDYPIDSHNDRFHAPLGIVRGQRTSLLGDPKLALDLLSRLSSEEKAAIISGYKPYSRWMSLKGLRSFLDQIPDLLRRAESDPLVTFLKNSEEKLKAHGITVIHVPMIPPDFLGSPIGIFYPNLISDTRMIASTLQIDTIVPTYGIPVLDNFTMMTLREVGHLVHPVDMRLQGISVGGPRCLVQLISMPASSPRPIEMK